MDIATDALGNPLVIGNTYGYSSSSGGSATTVIGVLEKIGSKKATIKISKRRYFQYGKPFNRSWSEDSPIAHPTFCILFPLNPELIE